MDRIAEYRINARVCAAQANAASEPFRNFYEALELEWRCLADQLERENEMAAREAAVENEGGGLIQQGRETGRRFVQRALKSNGKIYSQGGVSQLSIKIAHR